MSATIPQPSLTELRERLKAFVSPQARVVPGPVWLETALPDGGFPTGITELAAPKALGGSTQVVCDTVARLQRHAQAIAAWVDPEATLFGPGLSQRGVDVARLLAVQCPRAQAAAAAVRIARSGAVGVLVVDAHPVGMGPVPKDAFDERWLRRLQLAAEASGTCVLLLTDDRVVQRAPLPVALSLRLHRPSPAWLDVTVRKDRGGRLGSSRVPFPDKGAAPMLPLPFEVAS